MTMAYVYIHLRKDKNEIFYVGIGKIKNYKRAYHKKIRNDIWKNIVNKTQYDIQIIYDNISWEEACNKEIELIKLYGRIDLNTGTLANMTNGGDGNNSMTDSIKNKISNSLKGKKQSEETKKKRKEKLKEVWKCEELRELKRKQTKLLNELGLIGTRGKESKKKGIPLSDDQKNKLSVSLKNYFKNNEPHNKIKVSNETKNAIINEFLTTKTNISRLSKKYFINRGIISKILKENTIINNHENNKNISKWD